MQAILKAVADHEDQIMHCDLRSLNIKVVMNTKQRCPRSVVLTPEFEVDA